MGVTEVKLHVFQGQLPSQIPAGWCFIKDKVIPNAILHFIGLTPQGQFKFKLMPGYYNAVMFEEDQAKKLIDTMQLNNLEAVKCKELLGLPEAEDTTNRDIPFNPNENF